MGAILEQLLKPLPDIRTMPSVEARLIIAFRLAIVGIQNNYDCADHLADRCEMLGDSERERIFNDLRNFVAAYTGSRG